MISTFMKTLGPTYQLMLLTVSWYNFAEVVDKATKVELGIKASLVQNASLAIANSTRTTPKKASVTRQEANLVQAIEVPRPC